MMTKYQLNEAKRKEPKKIDFEEWIIIEMEKIKKNDITNYEIVIEK